MDWLGWQTVWCMYDGLCLYSNILVTLCGVESCGTCGFSKEFDTNLWCLTACYLGFNLLVYTIFFKYFGNIYKTSLFIYAVQLLNCQLFVSVFCCCSVLSMNKYFLCFTILTCYKNVCLMLLIIVMFVYKH